MATPKYEKIEAGVLDLGSQMKAQRKLKQTPKTSPTNAQALAMEKDRKSGRHRQYPLN